MNLLEGIRYEKIYGIIREDNPEKAYETAMAYYEGGIRFIEFNAPIEALKKFAALDKGVPIQGGIITASQAYEALEAGAKIISSPIFQVNLVRLATCLKINLIPSITTPNEAYSVWKARIPLMKVYPVNEMGGVEYIREMIKPMPFLNVLPCGFVKIDEIKAYLEAGAYAVGVGRDLYNKNSYEEIVQTVKNVIKSVNL